MCPQWGGGGDGGKLTFLNKPLTETGPRTNKTNRAGQRYLQTNSELCKIPLHMLMKYDKFTIHMIHFDTVSIYNYNYKHLFKMGSW